MKTKKERMGNQQGKKRKRRVELRENILVLLAMEMDGMTSNEAEMKSIRKP